MDSDLPVQMICVAPRLHVRVDPATVAERAGVLIQGQMVDALRSDGKWVLICSNGLHGWVARRYLRQVQK